MLCKILYKMLYNMPKRQGAWEGLPKRQGARFAASRNCQNGREHGACHCQNGREQTPFLPKRQGARSVPLPFWQARGAEWERPVY